MELVTNKVILGGQIPIYIQGGVTGSLVAGGATDYMMDDIAINLDICRSSDSTNKNKINDEQIIYTFKLSKIDELDDWINSSEYDFLAKCVRKFKLHMIYSNAVKGFFFDLVNLFERYVLEIISKAGMNKEKTLNEYEDFNIDQKLDSSSIILYKFGKDEKLNTYLINNAPYLAEYIKDKDRWSYIGWCPLVPDIRLRNLLGFPLELVDKFLELNINFDELGNELNKLQKIECPVIIKDTNLVKLDLDKKDKKEKIEILYKRIKSVRPELEAWENYYVKCAEQIIDKVKIFQKFFTKFGL